MALEEIVARFAARPEVVAVALAGSTAAKMEDTLSDYDIYVYNTTRVPLEVRTAIADELGQPPRSLNNNAFEAGDEWHDGHDGRGIDIILRDPAWLEGELDRVLIQHQASVGYSTAIWFNAKNSRPLFDRNGWFERIQARANAPYLDELRQAIVAKNWPILRTTPYAFVHQLEVAVARQDVVSLNHRVAALLASYFDILFAINRQPHPGEKRLLKWVNQICPNVPTDWEADVRGLLAASVEPGQAVVKAANTLLDGLDSLLQKENLL